MLLFILLNFFIMLMINIFVFLMPLNLVLTLIVFFVFLLTIFLLLIILVFVWLVISNETIGYLIYQILAHVYNSKAVIKERLNNNFLLRLTNYLAGEFNIYRRINRYLVVYIRLATIAYIRPEFKPTITNQNRWSLKLTRTKLRMTEYRFRIFINNVEQSRFRFFNIEVFSLRFYLGRYHNYIHKLFFFTFTCVATCIGRGRISNIIRIADNQ